MQEPELPSIQLKVPPEGGEKPFVSDEKILSYYEEVIENLREDRKEAQLMYENFAEMVIDNGDASPASKEALVNCLRVKTEANDRMIKILDLWTRIKMKDKDTFPKFMAVQQNNKVIKGDGSTRKMIETMMRMPEMENVYECKS